MKKLLILSGKGGTGKTTVAAGFISLLKTNVYADCDVDAPNLHLLKTPEGVAERYDFQGIPKAVIRETRCSQCGLCIEKCRFHAISRQFQKGVISIDPFKCEGCGVCRYICPEKAIEKVGYVTGEAITYRESIHFATAKLKMGAGASGKLVSEVKKNMELAPQSEAFAIIDGSPGIGCPVIASVTGVDFVVIVTEPTISGISDMKRILETVKYFSVPSAVIINKFDIHRENTEEIRSYCEGESVPVVGEIPYDRMVAVAMNQGKSIVEIECEAGRAMGEILNRVRRLI